MQREHFPANFTPPRSAILVKEVDADVAAPGALGRRNHLRHQAVPVFVSISKTKSNDIDNYIRHSVKTSLVVRICPQNSDGMSDASNHDSLVPKEG